jgi:xylulokinase
VSEDAVIDPSGAVAGFADATGRFLPLVCTLNATQATDAFARILGVSREEMDALALAGRPGAGGMVLLPYLNGERTPNRPEASGVLAGVRSDASREDVARAAFEGVVCSLLDGLDALAAVGVACDGELLLVGGGSGSPAYRQIVADLAGRAVTIPEGQQHVATGACVQAAAVLQGSHPDDVMEAWGLGDGEVVEPDEDVDREAVRAAFAAVRDRVPPTI